MDANLSRKAGAAKNTPYYRYARQSSGEDFDEQFIKTLIDAGTYENLSPSAQQFLRLCERSFTIAEEMNLRDMTDPDNLQQVIDKLLSEVPSEEIEEIDLKAEE